MGAAIGGAIVGFIVFGYLALRFLESNSGLLAFVVAALGAFLGGWFQIRRSDWLWHRLTQWFRWW